MQDGYFSDGQSLGSTLRQYREAQGLSIRQLAQLVETAPSMVSRWERDVWVPKPRTLARLAALLEVPLRHLTDISGLPYPAETATLPAMLRAEYDLPPAAIVEIEQSIQAIAKKYDTRSNTNDLDERGTL